MSIKFFGTEESLKIEIYLLLTEYIKGEGKYIWCGVNDNDCYNTTNEIYNILNTQFFNEIPLYAQSLIAFKYIHQKEEFQKFSEKIVTQKIKYFDNINNQNCYILDLFQNLKDTDESINNTFYDTCASKIFISSKEYFDFLEHMTKNLYSELMELKIDFDNKINKLNEIYNAINN